MVIKLGYHNDPPPIDNVRSHVEHTTRGKIITTPTTKQSNQQRPKRRKQPRVCGIIKHNTRKERPNKKNGQLERESNHTEGGIDKTLMEEHFTYI